MSASQQPPRTGTQRPLPYQWKAQYSGQNEQAQFTVNSSAMDRGFSRGVQRQTLNLQQTSYDRTNTALNRKINATTTLKSLAEQVLAEVEQEIAYLQQCMELTVVTLESKKAPQQASLQCLSIRSGRPPTECIRDEVEKSLEIQLAALAETVRVLESAYSAQQHEMQRLQMAKAALEADIVNKSSALDIDKEALSLNPSQPSTPMLASLPPSRGGVRAALDPSQWQGSTEKTCQMARGVVQVSGRLRVKTDSLIAESLQREKTVHASLMADLSASLARLQDSISSITSELNRVNDEMKESSDQIGSCQDSLAEKQQPMEIAQSRLRLRLERPDQEMVYDEAQKALEVEVSNIQQAVQNLTRELKIAVADCARLKATSEKLEATLALKQEFLQVEERCTDIQRSWETFSN